MTASQPPEWDRMPWPAKQRWMQRHGQPIIDATKPDHMCTPNSARTEAALQHRAVLREKALPLYEEGLTILQVADRLKVPPSQVQRAIAGHISPERAAQGRPGRTISVASAAWMRTERERRDRVGKDAVPLRARGWSVQRIAMKLGVSRGLVTRALAEASTDEEATG